MAAANTPGTNGEQDKAAETVEVDLTLGLYRRIYYRAIPGKRINAVSEGAALLFWHLNLIADDYGNFEDDPLLIKSQACPRRCYTPRRIAAFVAELEAAPLIVAYEVNGSRYLHIVDFCTLQPANRNGKRFRKYPAEPQGIDCRNCEAGQYRGNPGESRGIQGSPVQTTRLEDEDEYETEAENEVDKENEYEDENEGGRLSGKAGVSRPRASGSDFGKAPSVSVSDQTLPRKLAFTLGATGRDHQDASNATTLVRLCRHVLAHGGAEADLLAMAKDARVSTLRNKYAGFVAAVKKRWGKW